MDKDPASSSDPSDSATAGQHTAGIPSNLGPVGGGRSVKHQQQEGVVGLSSTTANSLSGMISQSVGLLNNPAAALSLNNIGQKIPSGIATSTVTGGSISSMTNNQLLSALSMLVSSSNSSPSYGQVPAPTLQLHCPLPEIGNAALFPHLLQLQQQQRQTFVPPTSVPQTSSQQTFGLNNQQLLALLLQQQSKSSSLFNPAGTNSGSNSNNINLLAPTSGSVTGSENNNDISSAFQRPPTSSGLELGTILSALSNSRNQQATGIAPSPPLPPVTAPPSSAPSTTKIPEGNSSNISSGGTNKSHNKSSTGDKAADYAREVAINKGARLLPCRARGMPMDHNIHVSALSVLTNRDHVAYTV
jgi:hypothetical protein